MTNYLNNIIISIVIITFFLFASCKESTCVCTVHNLNTYQSEPGQIYTVYGNTKRAKKACSGHEKTMPDYQMNVTYCEIK